MLHIITPSQLFSAVSPALVLPTITPGLDMHSVIHFGLDMHSMTIHGLDMHSTITHGGEHDDRLSGKGMSKQHSMLGLAESAGNMLSLFQFAILCLLHLH